MPRGRMDMPPGPGRPKGSKNRAPVEFAAYVREKTQDGRLMVDYALALLDGTEQPTGRYDAVKWRALRLDAAKWLADRGFGQAKAILEVEASEELPVLTFATLSVEDLRALKELAAKARA